MYKLIIIDDEEKIADGMAQLFPWQNIGFQVERVFTSARAALEYLEEHPVDVVLTDIEMPDMNGLELSRQLLNHPDIQKVFFSSYSNYEYFRAALQNGVADYLMKPVAYSALLECFEKIRTRLDARGEHTEEVPKAYYEEFGMCSDSGNLRPEPGCSDPKNGGFSGLIKQETRPSAMRRGPFYLHWRSTSTTKRTVKLTFHGPFDGLI